MRSRRRRPAQLVEAVLDLRAGARGRRTTARGPPRPACRRGGAGACRRSLGAPAPPAGGSPPACSRHSAAYGSGSTGPSDSNHSCAHRGGAERRPRCDPAQRGRPARRGRRVASGLERLVARQLEAVAAGEPARVDDRVAALGVDRRVAGDAARDDGLDDAARARRPASRSASPSSATALYGIVEGDEELARAPGRRARGAARLRARRGRRTVDSATISARQDPALERSRTLTRPRSARASSSCTSRGRGRSRARGRRPTASGSAPARGRAPRRSRCRRRRPRRGCRAWRAAAARARRMHRRRAPPDRAADARARERGAVEVVQHELAGLAGTGSCARRGRARAATAASGGRRSGTPGPRRWPSRRRPRSGAARRTAAGR